MNKEDMEILVKVKDEASNSFKNIGKNISNTNKELKSSFSFLTKDVSGLTTALTGIAVGAGVAFTGFMVSAVKAAANAEEAISSMDATLKSMGKTAIDSRDAILKAADATSKLGFDDEDAALSITKFYQRTKDLNESIKLNNIAMDLARAKHIGLSDAANMVNMVLSGNGRVLSQYGIKIKEAATPLEALRELQAQVAGQADAFASTFSGQMQILTVMFGNLKETIGSALIEALMPFIQQFTTWLNDPKTKEQFAYWTSEFKSWAEVIIPVVVDVFKLWIDVLKTVFNWLVQIGEKIMNVIDLVSKMASAIGSTAGKVGGSIGGVFSGLLKPRAIGGSVYTGSPYMVGENGPEMFIPTQNGRIIPNGQGIGQGGISVVLQGNFYGTDSDAAEKFADTIANIIGRQYKLRTI